MSEQNDIEKKEEVKDVPHNCQSSVPVKNKLGWVDKFLGKFVSRKLLVFTTATALLYLSELDAETWGLIAIIYVGGQSVIDAVKTYKYGDRM